MDWDDAPFPDVVIARRMDGPPEPGFDCGRAEQTAFLYERAYAEQEAQLSVTYMYYVKGILAAYATICMDALPLGPRERGRTVRYREVGALKLGQLGVARSFQKMGVGKIIVADVIARAEDEAWRVGCRYVTLDAQPELVEWYQKQGFKRNAFRQEMRVQDALAHGRNPDSIAVSMRFDLRER